MSFPNIIKQGLNIYADVMFIILQSRIWRVLYLYPPTNAGKPAILRRAQGNIISHIERDCLTKCTITKLLGVKKFRANARFHHYTYADTMHFDPNITYTIANCYRFYFQPKPYFFNHTFDMSLVKTIHSSSSLPIADICHNLMFTNFGFSLNVTIFTSPLPP
jgi:hypothetical protein